MDCPKCKQNEAHRSHRRGPFERLAGPVGFRAYRCHACEHRFLRLGHIDDAELAPATPSTRAEAEVLRTRNALGRDRRRREMLLYGFGMLLFVLFLVYLICDHGAGPSGD